MIIRCNFTAVVNHQGRYYAANRGESRIHVFEQQHDRWEQILLFAIDTSVGSYITLGISNELLYVSSFLDNKIDAYTLNGVFRFNAGNQGNRAAGEFRWPRICAADASGALLIADCYNDRLQVLSAMDYWSIVQLKPPVLEPASACLVDGTLYVSHQEKRKSVISKYKCD